MVPIVRRDYYWIPRRQVVRRSDGTKTVTVRRGPRDWTRTTTLPDGRTKVTTSTTELGPLGKFIWGGAGVLFAIIGPAMFLRFWSIPVYALEIVGVVTWVKQQNWGPHDTPMRQPAGHGNDVAPQRAAKSPTRTSQPLPPSQPAPSPPPPKPPTGWYPDPGKAGQRYWDGDAWTERSSPGPRRPTDGPDYQTQAERVSPEPPNEWERHGSGESGAAERSARTGQQDSAEKMTSMSKRRVGIDVVWQRIVAHQGERFRQIRGKEFTYTIVGQGAALSTTNQTLPKSIFAQALERMPVRSTTPLQDLRGPSYLYAILMDSRIRQQDW